MPASRDLAVRGTPYRIGLELAFRELLACGHEGGFRAVDVHHRPKTYRAWCRTCSTARTVIVLVGDIWTGGWESDLDPERGVALGELLG